MNSEEETKLTLKPSEKVLYMAKYSKPVFVYNNLIISSLMIGLVIYFYSNQFIISCISPILVFFISLFFCFGILFSLLLTYRGIKEYEEGRIYVTNERIIKKEIYFYPLFGHSKEEKQFIIKTSDVDLDNIGEIKIRSFLEEFKYPSPSDTGRFLASRGSLIGPILPDLLIPNTGTILIKKKNTDGNYVNNYLWLSHISNPRGLLNSIKKAMFMKSL